MKTCATMPSAPDVRRLYDALAGRSDDAVVLVAGGVPCTAGELRAWLGGLRMAAEARRGRRVAVAAAEARDFILRLFALDGVAAALLLLPGDMAAGQTAELRARAQCDADAAALGAADPANEPAADAGPVVETAWILPTSGTTGTPKLVSHTLRTLTRTVRATASVDAAGDALRWGLLYDPARFAGLQVVLQALLSDAPLVLPDRGAAIEAQILALAAGDCTALSATPTLWRKILMTGLASRLTLRQVTLGGEIVDEPVLRALRRAWPDARLTHIYASTEAGVGFSVHDGRTGFPVRYLEQPPRGVALRVDEDGFLWVRPDLGGQFFVADATPLAGADGWINTGDLVRREGDRYLFLGRAGGAINVGGNKVHPEEVEQVLAEVAGVAQVLVRPRRSSITGALVEAVIVPVARDLDADGRAALCRQVQQHCAARLPAYKQPAIVRVVEALPVSGAGKLPRGQG